MTCGASLTMLSMTPHTALKLGSSSPANLFNPEWSASKYIMLCPSRTAEPCSTTYEVSQPESHRHRRSAHCEAVESAYEFSGPVHVFFLNLFIETHHIQVLISGGKIHRQIIQALVSRS